MIKVLAEKVTEMANNPDQRVSLSSMKQYVHVRLVAFIYYYWYVAYEYERICTYERTFSCNFLP